MAKLMTHKLEENLNPICPQFDITSMSTTLEIQILTIRCLIDKSHKIQAVKK